MTPLSTAFAIEHVTSLPPTQSMEFEIAVERISMKQRGDEWEKSNADGAR